MHVVAEVMRVALANGRAGGVDGLVCPDCVRRDVVVRVSGQRPGGAVEDQAEVGQSAQVERGGSVVKPVVVFGRAAIAPIGLQQTSTQLAQRRTMFATFA